MDTVPAEYLDILKPAPLSGTLFALSAVEILIHILYIFGANLKWNELSEQHQHQSSNILVHQEIYFYNLCRVRLDCNTYIFLIRKTSF